ncbi:MAG TPA: FGGY-family carbohydrate kinase [Acidimicrobiales bacterium]|nr:MAG: hypothetical protein B7Z69_04260 [Actinobacteria bacterium 21-73-9]HQU26174.1 FGGY-family carbohydrate kinase [Acidimicrobiales bacterium]
MATVLAIDLGTSRVKVGLLDERLRLLGSAAATYPTARDATGAAEQRPEDWLGALARASREALASPGASPDAVVLTAQMPTLVALGADGEPLGPAVTWQDGRADGLVEDLGPTTRARVEEVSGAPLDGRYLVPMERRRLADGQRAASRLLSAKDFLFMRLTGALVTDPSTASGYGLYDLARETWSDELLALWGVEPATLPEVAPSAHAEPLTPGGAELLGVGPAGLPVYLGGADSVCAHHFVETLFPGSVSVVDGSSSVVLATLTGARPPRVLVSPLVGPGALGAEMDLLATGASLAWLAETLGLGAGAIEEVALSHPDPAGLAVTFRPYLAGGEQGALWRSDLAGSIEGISLTTTRADLARALYEGIAFETARCLLALAPFARVTRVVALTSPKSRSLGPALLAAASGLEVTAVGGHSPSLVGAGIVALGALGAGPSDVVAPTPSALPRLPDAAALAGRAARYLATAPSPEGGAS